MRSLPLAPFAAAFACLSLGSTSRAQEKPAYGLSGDWGGLRDSWFEHGVGIDFSVTFEANRVLAGGLQQRTTGQTLYDLYANFDLERIAGWKDALILCEAYVRDGHNPSEDAGDFQGLSDISARELAQIGQVYYEQWFAEHSWRLKLGKMDAYSDFGAPGNGTESIHSSTFFSPTTFAMVGYPNPAMGILAGWVPSAEWTLELGVYDGATALGVETGGLGPATFFGDPPGDFCIGELQRRWKLGAGELAGGATLGAWRHTGTFDEFSGGTVHGTGGLYGTLDQELSRAAQGRSGGTQSAFVQFGRADEDVAPVDSHLGLGFRWAGACSARPDDALGLYVSRAHFSAGFASGAETAWELDYLLPLGHGITLRPDLQWIANPGGDPSVDDALVFSLRCELSF
jgi:porin